MFSSMGFWWVPGSFWDWLRGTPNIEREIATTQAQLQTTTNPNEQIRLQAELVKLQAYIAEEPLRQALANRGTVPGWVVLAGVGALYFLSKPKKRRRR